MFVWLTQKPRTAMPLHKKRWNVRSVVKSLELPHCRVVKVSSSHCSWFCHLEL